MLKGNTPRRAAVQKNNFFHKNFDQIFMKKAWALLPMAALFLLLNACEKEDDASKYTDAATCTGDVPTYSKDVKTIIDDNCAYSGCHSASSKAGKISLEGYSAASDEFLNGESLCTIYHDCKPMPQGSAKLDDATIQLLTCWVKNDCPQ